MPIDAVVNAVAEAKGEAGYVEPSGGYAQVRAPEPAAGGGEEEDARPSAADLEKIDKDPVLRATYRSLMRKFHSGNESIAAKNREAEAAQEAVRAFHADPEGSLRAMAAAVGLRVAERGEAAGAAPGGRRGVDRVRERLEKAVGKEAAEALAPVLSEIVGEITDDAVGSLRERVDVQQAETTARQISAGINSFATEVVKDGGDWGEDIEREMAALVGTVMPGPQTTMPEYLRMLHAAVTARRSPSSRRPTVGLAAHAAEDQHETRRDPGIHLGMDAREATRLAVAAAQAQVKRR